MDAFLILCAILASVVLLFRYAVPLAKPKLSQSERLSDNALKNRLVMLAKRCAKTKRGFGIYYRHIDFDKILKRIAKKADGGNYLNKWERALFDDREMFIQAYDRSLEAMRLGHTLGHVDGYPRLFLLCSEMVECRQGDVTGGTIDMSLDTFQAYAPLTSVEHAAFPSMLAFCLCALVCDAAHRAFKRDRSYDKGVNDGKVGKADLDGLTDVDYVDGLFDASDVPDKDAVVRLFENNGVDRAQCEYMRTVFLAQTYALVKAVKRSLIAIADRERTHTEPALAKVKAPSKRIVAILNIAPVLLILTVAVLTCVFVPYEYAAVSVAAAILFYGCFRLPLLLYAPFARPFEVFARFVSRFKRRHADNKKSSHIPSLQTVRANAEIAYFGCEPIYSSRNVFGGRVQAVCDNRGTVRLKRASARQKPDRLEIFFEHNGETIELSACDGVYDGRKYTYRAFSDLVEFAVEIITPIDCDSCCCMISIVNRSHQKISVKLSSALIMDVNGNMPEPQISDDRIAVAVRSNAVALRLDGITDYGMTVDKQATAAFMRLSATRQVEVNGFCKRDLMLSAAYGSSVLEIDSVLDRLYCDGYYEYASDGLDAFSHDDNVARTDPPNNFCMLPEPSERAKYASPPDAYEPDGYLADGAFTLSSASKIYADGHVCNTLCNGEIGIRLYQNSIGEIFRVRPYRSVTAEGSAYKDTDKVCMMIGEGSVTWSPVGGRYGRGDTRVEHCLGHTTYFCAYNGCVCELECRLSDNSDVVFFDLTIKNRVPFARCLDVLLSVFTSEKRVVARYGNGLTAQCSDASMAFALLCSQQIREIAGYKESYLSHGRISDISSLNKSGSTPAPTLSARVKIEPYDGARVVFCLAMGNEPNMQAASIACADAASAAEREMRRRAERVKLLSDDNVLNAMHLRALYKAHVGALLSDGSSVARTCAILRCVKYADRTFVRRKLIELLGKQDRRGTFGSRTDGVWVAYAVADYAEHACDYGIFDEHVAYAPETVRGKREIETDTVKERLLRAIDMSALSCSDEPAFCVVYYKTLADVLRYYGALCAFDNVRLRKYRSALNRAISEHTLAVKRFVDRGERDDDILLTAVALYACGKYDKAYAALKKLERSIAARPDINGGEEETVSASVYYTLVTEKLTGLKMRGNRVKIDPHMSQDAPHLEFSLRSDNGGSVHVVVDDKAGNGDWRIRADKISYALNSVILGEKDNGKIVLYRDAIESE